MISGDDFKFQNILAFLKGHARPKLSALLEIFGRKPDGERFSIKKDVLALYKGYENPRFTNPGNLTVFGRCQMFVRNAFGPVKGEAFKERRQFDILTTQIFMRD